MDTPHSFADAAISPHAAIEIRRRQLTSQVIRRALAQPEQVLPVRAGRVVLHLRFSDGVPKKDYLLRVFVDTHSAPPVVVTLYRTSKIEKYWSTK